MSRRIVLLRGLSVAPWDLRPHELLGPDYHVSVLVPRGNLYSTSELSLEREQGRTLSDMLPGGLAGRLAARAFGERFVGLAEHLREADIVHVAELGNWYSAQAARLKPRLGFRLVVTAWETLPLRDAYRNVRTRPYARQVIAEGDRFLACTERAQHALLLEGAAPERTLVCPPGIDLDRFAAARAPRPPADGSHLILSAGRLVWEKGHQDLIRALALLRLRGRTDVRALIVGSGPEASRLKALVGDLGLRDSISFLPSVPYDEMPSLYAKASCLVLASIPVRYWEEQFGMVLAEAMAGHVPVVASSSGAIPEVVGPCGQYVAPGDWVGLADTLASGPLAGPPGLRSVPEEARLRRFSTTAAAERLMGVYNDLPER